MADYAQYGGMPPVQESYQVSDGPGFATMANWAGAIVSMALVVGIGVWGYKLVMRDVTGVPVIQAAEGPMRVAPEEPGGRAAAHQGLAVNRVAGIGNAAPPADRLVLAPRPVELDDEDQPQIVPLSAPSFAEDQAERLELAVLREEIAAEDRIADVDVAPEVPNSVQELADQIAANLTPLQPLEPGNDVPVKTELSAVSAAATGPGLVRSLRPKVRPGPAVRSASLAPVAPQTAAAVAEIDARQVPSGERLVQLGAYDSPDVARTEWDRLSGRFGEYLSDKTRVIQKASSGGRVFYRLRAMGFADLSDARQFCAAFVAGNADCIPVVAK